jgi:hypothetical protein
MKTKFDIYMEAIQDSLNEKRVIEEGILGDLKNKLFKGSKKESDNKESEPIEDLKKFKTEAENNFSVLQENLYRYFKNVFSENKRNISDRDRLREAAVEVLKREYSAKSIYPLKNEDGSGPKFLLSSLIDNLMKAQSAELLVKTYYKAEFMKDEKIDFKNLLKFLSNIDMNHASVYLKGFSTAI